MNSISAGLPKKAEIFFFFQITDVTKFRSGLSKLIPHIASTTDVTQAREDIVKKKMADKNCSLNLNFLNISFAAKGLQKLGIKDDVKDDVFVQGQLSDAKSLGDPGQIHGKDFEPDWIYPFKHEIHGVLLVAGATNQSVQFHLDAALAVLVGSVREVYKIVGNVRPGPEDGHEQ